jgi:hypothetical protein
LYASEKPALSSKTFVMEPEEEVVDVEFTENGVSLLYEKPHRKLTLQIVEIRRYIVDGIFLRTVALTEDKCPLHEAFDIVLSDGEKKTKCLLFPPLNELIYKHKLDLYYIVEVSDWEVRLDEWKGASPFIVIKDIVAAELERQPDDILSVHAENEPWQEPQWHPNALQQAMTHMKKREQVKKLSKVKKSLQLPSERVHEAEEKDKEALSDYLSNRPMVGNRGSYVALECNDSVVGSQWKASTPKFTHYAKTLEDIFIDDHEEYATIREVKARYLNQRNVSKKSKSSPPFLVARIFKKGPINNYAAITQKDNRYPFNFAATIGDHTGRIDMVVWSSWCVRYYNTLQVGDVIIVRNYRIQPAYERDGELELTVNPYNPVGDIRILIGPVLDMFAIPGVHLRLVESKTLLESPKSDQEIDFVGLVTYVSQLLRIRSANSFSAMVWLKLRDHHSAKDISVKLFANSQLETLKKIALGDVVMLTNMKVGVFSLHDEPPANFIYLESTHFTEIYTNEEVEPLNLPQINEVLKLAKTIDLQREKNKSEETKKYSNYYIQFPDITTLKRFFGLSSEIHTFFDDVETHLNEMHFRQHKVICIYAFLTSLKLAKLSDKRVVYTAQLTDLNRKKTLEAIIPMHNLSIVDVLNLNLSDKRERIGLLLRMIRLNFGNTENWNSGDQHTTTSNSKMSLNLDFVALRNKITRENDESVSLSTLAEALAQQPLYFILDCYFGDTSSKEIVITNIYFNAEET